MPQFQVMITKEEFDKLLDLTMLELDDEEYARFFGQMDQIITFVNKIEEYGEKDDENKNFKKIGVSLSDRSYQKKSIGLSNVTHPITGNMIQIKFKRGTKGE